MGGYFCLTIEKQMTKFSNVEFATAIILSANDLQVKNMFFWKPCRLTFIRLNLTDKSIDTYTNIFISKKHILNGYLCRCICWYTYVGMWL